MAGEAAKRASAWAAPERISETGADRQPEAGEPGAQIGDEALLAAVEMRNSRHVDPQAVLAVDVAVGAIAAAPARKLAKCRAVALGLCRT